VGYGVGGQNNLWQIIQIYKSNSMIFREGYEIVSEVVRCIFKIDTVSLLCFLPRQHDHRLRSSPFLQLHVHEL
jgi:hypothetical protein